MRKSSWRRLGIGLGALVVLLIAALVAIFQVDLSGYKADVEQMASARLCRDVRIAGTFEPDLSLHPSVRLEDVSVSQPQEAGSGEFLTAGSVFARVSLWSVVSGPLWIEEINASGARVTIGSSEGGDSTSIAVDELVLRDPVGNGILAGELSGSVDERPFSGSIAFGSTPDFGRIDVSEIDLLLGESQIAGNITVELSEPPVVSAALRSPHWILEDADTAEQTPIEPEPTDGAELSSEPTSEAEAGSSDRLFSDVPISFAALDSIVLDAEIAVERLTTRYSEVQDIHVPIRIDAGNLSLGPVTAGINGGQVTAEMVLQRDGGIAAATLLLSGEEIRFGDPMVEGEETVASAPPLEILAELRGRGTTPHEFALSASGDITILQGAGRRDQDALGFLANDFIAEIFSALNPFAEEDPYTEFDCGIFFAEIADGVAALSPLTMRTGKMVVTGSGSIDLDSEQIDVSIDTKPREGLGLAAAGFVTPFVKLSGTLAEPSIGLDAAGALIQGGLAVVTGGASLVGKEMLDRLTSEFGDCSDPDVPASEENPLTTPEDE
ncbi:MAG: AsmA family protein [Gammaproteobacteria bacterium]